MCIITVYPKKYAHGFVVLCCVVVMQSFIMNSHELFIHIHQGYFAGTGAIVRLPQCQWSTPDGYGKISQCITTTKQSKAKTVCIFLGIYCMTRFYQYISYQNNMFKFWITTSIWLSKWVSDVTTQMVLKSRNCTGLIQYNKKIGLLYIDIYFMWKTGCIYENMKMYLLFNVIHTCDGGCFAITTPLFINHQPYNFVVYSPDSKADCPMLGWR